MQPTVLVVEDEPDIVALLRDFLSVAGFCVLPAGDAAAAVAALAEHPVDCVLVDVMLPGSSGFELCRRIRESSDVPLLFLSARGDASDKLRGLGLGADDYIVKTRGRVLNAEWIAAIAAMIGIGAVIGYTSSTATWSELDPEMTAGSSPCRASSSPSCSSACSASCSSPASTAPA